VNQGTEVPPEGRRAGRGQMSPVFAFGYAVARRSEDRGRRTEERGEEC